MDEKIIKLVNDSEKELDKEFKKIDEICEYNSLKVLKAFGIISYQKRIFHKQQVMDMMILVEM